MIFLKKFERCLLRFCHLTREIALTMMNNVSIPKERIRTITMKKLQKYFSYFYMGLCPILCFFLLETYTHNPFETMKPLPIFLNLVLFELLAFCLLALTGCIRVALLILLSFCCMYGLLNYFVLQFRGTPIQPWDLLSLSTAWSVADSYEYSLDSAAAFSLLGFVLLLAGALFCRPKLHRLRCRLAMLAVTAVLLTGYTCMLHNEPIVETRLKLYNKLFTPTAIQNKNGTLTAFLMETQYMAVKKPAGYDAKDAAALLASFTSDSQTSSAEVSQSLPNIIVIMNEAFSDPAVLGSFSTNQDYMPFVHSMLEGAENTISGHLSVSVKGGNTANTEFEFLTGSTMAFLPAGSVPYQQYIHAELPTLVSHLQDLGYRTVSMHPYGASGWERDQVYPNLGFEESYFISHFKNTPKVRKYISDQGNYEKIIQLFSQKEPGQPLFLFNITMQNHSSYSDWNDYDNFTPDITVTDSSSKLLPAYLSLIHLSDQAIARLVEWLSSQEEDTLLVFFGDHQPTDSIVNPILALHQKTASSLTEEEESLRYQVPFFIWANYDMNEQTHVETSVNYLGVKTLEAAGLPLPAFFSFLADQQQTVPVLSAGNVKLSDSAASHPQDPKDLLQNYQTLQYYLLFDSME